MNTEELAAQAMALLLPVPRFLSESFDSFKGGMREHISEIENGALPPLSVYHFSSQDPRMTSFPGFRKNNAEYRRKIFFGAGMALASLDPVEFWLAMDVWFVVRANEDFNLCPSQVPDRQMALMCVRSTPTGSETVVLPYEVRLGSPVWLPELRTISPQGQGNLDEQFWKGVEFARKGEGGA